MANIVVFTFSAHVVVDVKVENPLLDHYQLLLSQANFLFLFCVFDF